MTIAADIGSNVCLQPDLQDPFYLHLYDLLQDKTPPEEVEKALIESLSEESFNDPFSHVEGYRKLLALFIISTLREDLSTRLEEIRFLLFDNLRSVKTWQEYQLVTAYKKLCEELAGESDLHSIDINLEEGGYAQIEYGQHWSWAEKPLQPYHIELGVIWALLGIHLNEQCFISASHQIALFQLNLLDSDYLPLQGLFTREKDAVVSKITGWCSTLFHCIGHSHHKPEYISICQEQRDFLRDGSKSVHPLVPLIFEWKPFGKTLNNARKTTLPATISYPSLGMCGKRSDQLISMSTLTGGRTGLGTYHVNRALSIVTFGPQYQPYGECQGFGVESNQNTQNKFPNLVIEEKGEKYLVKGYTKLAGNVIYESPYPICGNTSHSEIWLDVKQEFDGLSYDLEVNYLSYQMGSPLSFVFYVKAAECEILGMQTLKPKSLDRYQGDVEELIFSSNSQRINLKPAFADTAMEVIPLAGDDSFWGCDFLVGFAVNERALTQHWTITHSFS